MNTRLPWGSLALIAACALLPTILRGQIIAPPPPQPGTIAMPKNPAPPCDTCYRGFRRYDPAEFRFGAICNVHGQGEVLKDSLHLDFLYTYLGPNNLARIQNPSLWHAYGTNYRVIDSLDKLFYEDLDLHGVNVVYAPGAIRPLADCSDEIESYFAADFDTIHVSDFVHTATADGRDTVPHGWVFGGIFNASTGTVSPTRMAWNPRFTDHGLGGGGFYEAIDSAQLNGTYDLTVAMKAGPFTPLVDSLALLGYAKVYRRVVLGQNDCKCNFYAPVDSLAITRTVYESPTISRPAGTDYKDITFTLRFDPDSVRPADSVRIARASGDTMVALQRNVWVQKFLPPNNVFAAGVEGNDSTAGCPRFCARLLQVLKDSGWVPQQTLDLANPVEESDIYYDVYTTHKVPVTFLRGRMSARTYTLLRKGLFDAFIHRQIDSVFGDTILRRRLERIAISDEQTIHQYKPYMEIGSRIARQLADSNDLRGLYSNPVNWHNSFRITSGDLDTTDIRLMHVLTAQAYVIGADQRIPLFYPNPDRMHDMMTGYTSTALTTYYPAYDIYANGSRVKSRIIAYNTPEDYQAYTAQSQDIARSKVGQLFDAEDVARARFAHIRSIVTPVYNVVQVHGYLASDASGWTGSWAPWRPPTPEEITMESWLCVAMGTDGIVFSDFSFDAAGEFGVMHWLSGDHSKNYDSAMVVGLPWKDSLSGWQLPKMWTGFKDRFNAVKRFTNEFTSNILPAYRTLDRNSTHATISLVPSLQSVPMIDTIYTQRAYRWKDSLGRFQDTTLYDARNETYLEATIFRPRTSNQDSSNWRYLCLVNTRCWPYDSLSYSRYVRDTLSPGSDSVGFGAIDVRKPFIKLKNSTNVLADQFIVEKVGDSTWSRTVSIDSIFALDWLEPGWGAMYRIKPVPILTSKLGTSYNNSIHSVTVPYVTGQNERTIVYERDSIIYMRTLDPGGNLSSEIMVSDSADTESFDGRRAAYNMNPAIGVTHFVDDDDHIHNHYLVVWEHHDSTMSQASVEGKLYDESLTPDAPARVQGISNTFNLPDLDMLGIRLTPAVVGVDRHLVGTSNAGFDDGFVVAWASPRKQIEACFIRNSLARSTTISDFATPIEIKFNLDSTCQFPTLAFARTDHGQYNVDQAVHLAYQQGPANGKHYIMYTQLRLQDLDTTATSSTPRNLAVHNTEHVSYGLQACDFLHPSIAADSARIGVAFEMHGSSSTVALRFRDTFGLNAAWQTPVYKWGRYDQFIGSYPVQLTGTKNYEYPSLVHFPAVAKDPLRRDTLGGLCWHWTNVPANRRFRQLLYRYGRTSAQDLPDGQFPTMTLAPYADTFATAFDASSLLFRGTDSSRVSGTRPSGGSAWYFPAYLENTPLRPSPLFSSTAAGRIYSSYRVFPYLSVYPEDECGKARIDVGLQFPSVQGTAPKQPALPPSFFQTPTQGNTLITSLAAASEIARTSVFEASTDTISVERIIAGSDSLLSWLNDPEYNPIGTPPADIKVLTELVRTSDSAVIWHSDTISARTIGADVWDNIVNVPVPDVASPGTNVFIRLRSIVSDSLLYSLGGSFQFIEDTTDPALNKIRRLSTKEGPAITGNESAIRLRVVPNPLHNTGELRINVREPAELKLTIYDVLGRVVRRLLPATLKEAGEFAIPIDMNGLPNGIYTIRAESESAKAATKFSMVR
jgi:hypothetical protein